MPQHDAEDRPCQSDGVIQRKTVSSSSFDFVDAALHQVKRIMTSGPIDVMAGFDLADPVTDAGVGHIPKTYTAFLDPGTLKGKRLGVLRQVFGRDVVHAEVNRVMMRILDRLLELGAVVFDIEIPDLGALTADIGLADYELKAGLDKYLAGLGGPVQTGGKGRNVA